MSILGLRHTGNFVTNQRPENWRQTLLLLYPNSADAAKAPLTALTSLMKSESTDDPVFHWWQKKLDDRRLQLAEDLDTNATQTVTIDDSFKSAFIVKAGDVLLVEESGEIVRVSSDPTADDTIVLTRGVGGTSPTAVTYAAAGVNPYLSVIGSAFPENSTAPSGVNYDPTEKSNYTQIFRSTLEMSRTAQKTRLRTGDAVKEAKRECLEYIGIDMERAFWFGKKQATTLNGNPLRYTDGIIAQILAGAPNNTAAAPNGGLITLEWLETVLEQAFRFGSSEKMLFASNTVLLAIQQAVRKNSQWNIQNGLKEFGMRVSRLVTPFGEVVLKVHPLFNQMVGGTNQSVVFNGIANNGYILDMANFKYRYIDDLKYEPKLEQPGLDGMKSGYLAECGIEVHHAESHFILTGIRGGDADA